MNEIYQSKIMQYLRNTFNERQLWCVCVSVCVEVWNFWRRMQKKSYKYFHHIIFKTFPVEFGKLRFFAVF